MTNNQFKTPFIHPPVSTKPLINNAWWFSKELPKSKCTQNKIRDKVRRAKS